MKDETLNQIIEKRFNENKINTPISLLKLTELVEEDIFFFRASLKYTKYNTEGYPSVNFYKPISQV